MTTNKTTYCIPFLLFFCSIYSNAQMQKEINLGSFMLKVPSEMKTLSMEQRNQKYTIQGQIPNEVYQTENDDVNISYMATLIPLVETQFPALKTNLEEKFANPNSEILNSEIVQLDGKKFVLTQVLSKTNNVLMTSLVTSDFGKMVMVIISHSTKRKNYELENEAIVKSLRVI